MLNRLRRQWFLAALLAAAAAGLLLPGAGSAARPAVAPLVAVVMLLSGFGLSPRNLARQARDPRGILIAFAGVYLAAPAAAFLAARLFQPAASGGDFLEAVMVLAAQAGTISSAIALTMMANGNAELAVLITLCTNSSTVIMTPLVLKASIGAEVHFELGKMSADMALTLLAPVAAGILLRWALRRFAGWSPGARILVASRIAAQCIILLFALVGFSRAGPRLSQDPGLAARFLGVVALLHAVLLLFNWGAARAARLDRASRAAVLFTGSQKTLPNGIFTAETFFPANPYAALPMVLYHLLQLIVDTLLVPWVRRDGPAAMQTGSAGGADLHGRMAVPAKPKTP